PSTAARGRRTAGRRRSRAGSRCSSRRGSTVARRLIYRGAPRFPEVPLMRPVRAVSILIAAVLVATGCYRSDIAIDVDDDGSGTFQMVFALDRDAWSQLGAFGMLGDESTAEDFGDDPCGQIRAEIEGSSASLPR